MPLRKSWSIKQLIQLVRRKLRAFVQGLSYLIELTNYLWRPALECQRPHSKLGIYVAKSERMQVLQMQWP
jgi:hypothetical protein